MSVPNPRNLDEVFGDIFPNPDADKTPIQGQEQPLPDADRIVELVDEPEVRLDLEYEENRPPHYEER